MSLEIASYISQLQNSNPTPQDPINQGDDHIRLIKKVLQTQFPGSGGSGFTKAITATEDELNYVHGVTSAIQPQFQGVVPIGGIIMWSGAVAPANWRICDGTNSTPDLRNKFVMGASTTHVLSTTGGDADAVVVSHTHIATSTPNIAGLATASDTHNHTFTTSTENLQHTHSYTTVLGAGGSSVGSGGLLLGAATSGGMSDNVTHNHTGTTTSDTHSHDVTGTMTVATTNAVPVGSVVGTDKNLPPFYALAYIQRYQ